MAGAQLYTYAIIRKERKKERKGKMKVTRQYLHGFGMTLHRGSMKVIHRRLLVLLHSSARRVAHAHIVHGVDVPAPRSHVQLPSNRAVLLLRVVILGESEVAFRRRVIRPFRDLRESRYLIVGRRLRVSGPSLGRRAFRRGRRRKGRSRS